MRTRSSTGKAVVAAIALVPWCVFGATTMLVARALRSRLVETFPLFFHGAVCRLFSLDCEIEGEPAKAGPTLFVANHASYLDVFVLGSVVPGSFVAKSEVASWPVFGKLAKLQNTLFLERRANKAREQIEVVRNHLRSEGNIIMFPEGTSTPGTHVEPFRSSLFAAAEDVLVQPVSIAYVHYDAEPMTQAERDHYAWYLPNPKTEPGRPNRPFAAHFFTALGLGRCTVKIAFHEPFQAAAGDRKASAERSETLVRSGLERLLASTNEPGNELSAAP